MKNERLLDIIGQVDDKYIEEARTHKGKLKIRWAAIGALAACAVLCVTIGFNHKNEDIPVNPHKNPITSVDGSTSGEIDTLPDVNDPDTNTDPENNDPENPPIDTPVDEAPKIIDGLPVITISSKNSLDGGFEGYSVYDISELVSGNPWNEDILVSTLPIYKNNIEFNNLHIITNPNISKMRELLLETAVKLDLDTSKLEIEDYTDGKNPYHWSELYTETENVELSVTNDLTIEIKFKAGIKLPEKYKFDSHSSFTEASEVAEYFSETYKDLIGFSDIKIDVSGGDRNIHLEQSHRIYFYEDADDIQEKILNYNFRKINFISNEKGELCIIRIYNTDTSDKIGDYPIISLDEAKDSLINGNYYTTTPSDQFPGEEYIAKAELVYQTGSSQEYFIPYYKFYIELPKEAEYQTLYTPENIKVYGAYYVPAVDQKWIKSDLIFGNDY